MSSGVIRLAVAGLLAVACATGPRAGFAQETPAAPAARRDPGGAAAGFALDEASARLTTWDAALFPMAPVWL